MATKDDNIITLHVDHMAMEGKVLARHIEILLKYLFLVNGHIPNGYEDMRKSCTQAAIQTEFTKRAARFLSSADELFHGLSASICSNLIKEVVLIFGGTLFTPKFTVTIELPCNYDPIGSSNEWADISDPSGFPIQLVENFTHLSKAFDQMPSNIWLLLRVEETKIQEVSSIFRLDRRFALSQKGHHLKICLTPQQAPVQPDCFNNCSGFCPISPVRNVGGILSHSVLETSGITPMSPVMLKEEAWLSYDTNLYMSHVPELTTQEPLAAVYFTLVHCLKGFR